MSEAKGIVRARIRVTGRVQGVYFRASAREEATRLGLVGWVRNAADGAVEIEVEGPEELVSELVAWAHQGPPVARVADVVESSIDTQRDETEFRVRY